MSTAVWKGHLTFGLVSIPIKLYRAARAEKVSFRQLHRTWTPRAGPLPSKVQSGPSTRAPRSTVSASESPGDNQTGGVQQPLEMRAVERISPVRQQVLAGTAEAPVARDQLVKGYQYAKDQYVVVEKEELKALMAETGGAMEILEFVKLDEIDPVYFESSYYVVPETVGTKPYSLLYEALRQSEFVGIAQLAMHRRNHVVVLRPGARGLLLHTMFYSTEIRGQDEFPADRSLVSDREVEMGKLLIGAMAAEFTPEKFRDTYKDRLEVLIQTKIEGRKVTHIDKVRGAPATDIMKALQTSLENARKPPGSAALGKPSVAARKKRG